MSILYRDSLERFLLGLVSTQATTVTKKKTKQIIVLHLLKKINTGDISLLRQGSVENVSVCSRPAAVQATLTCGLISAKGKLGEKKTIER